MRRMLPQKLIDYIKEIKNVLGIDENDDIAIKGNVSVDGSGIFLTSGQGISDEGIWINEDDVINDIGDGLEVEDGSLKLEAPIWKKMDATFVRNQQEQYNEVILPSFIGTKALIKFTQNNIEHQYLILLNSANPSVSFIVLGDGEDVSRDVSALLVNSSSEDCYFDIDLQTESSIDCVIYYEDFVGPTFTI